MKLAALTLDGRLRTIAKDLAGGPVGRPYSAGVFTLSRTGLVAYTQGGADRVADIAVVPLKGGTPRRLTDLSRDLIAQRDLGRVGEVWAKSSHDGKRIQAWVCTPPGFDPAQKYPLLLEIHGGPFSQYGNKFFDEFQAYARAGYAVVYSNPRGSSGYSEEWGRAIRGPVGGGDGWGSLDYLDANGMPMAFALEPVVP